MYTVNTCKKYSYSLILKTLLFVVIATSCTSFFAQQTTEKALVKSFQTEKNKKEQFWLLVELGEYYKFNNVQKADSLKKEIINRSLSLGDSAQFFALLYDAEMDKNSGNKDLYYNKILGLQPFLYKIQSNKIKLEIYQRLGDFHLYYREFEQASFYLNQSFILSKKIRDNKAIAETYILLAQKQMQLNQKDSAMLYVNEAIQFARRSSTKTTMAIAINRLASIYAYFGQFELSVSKNLVALQLAQEIGDYPKVAQFALDLGDAQLEILNYREANKYFKQALEVGIQIKDQRLEALAKLNLGVIFLKEKKYQQSIQLQKDAIRTLMKLNDMNGLGLAHNNLGDIYREKKDYATALSNYNKSLVYFESTGNREKIATVYHSVGIVFEKQGKHENALNYLNRCVEIRSQFGYTGAKYPAFKSISEVYANTGNKQLAYKYLKMYTDFSDSAKTLESSAKIAELNELYRSEQRERLISLQADSIDRQQQEREFASTQLENIQLKNNMQAYIILGFALVIILGGIIFFYRWNQSKIKQQQKEAEMNQTLLRAQMNPHFVFNAMSVIQSYIYDNDIKNSSKFLVAFSKLMRLILENSSKEFIPMTIEVDILDKYLGIQKLRFEDRFEYEIIVDPKLLDENCVIPPMITQPFIENAIEHGQLHLREDGFIKVHFFEKNGMLNITVVDNGVGRKKSSANKKSSAHKSMAMKITKDRIDNLNKKYRSDGSMHLEDFDKISESGTKVLISIPYRIGSQQIT
jgi:tetratricopeptide (TPR) repeat protein